MISAVCLGVALYLANPRRLLRALQLANYRLIILAAFVSILWLLIRALAWRTLLQERATFSQTFYTVNEGYLLNNILPFRLGEVARAFLMSRKANLSFFWVFSTIVIERILDLAFAAGLLLITLSFVVGASWALEAALVAGGIVLVGLVMLYLLARNREWALSLFERLSSRWSFLQKVGGPQLQAFLDGLAVITDAGHFVRAIAYMALDWLVVIIQNFILMKAFFPDARFLFAAFSLGIAALGIATPSSPGAVGVMELAILAALSVFGLDPAVSLAFALSAHLMNYLVTGIFGSIGLVKDGESLFGLYYSARGLLQKGVD